MAEKQEKTTKTVDNPRILPRRMEVSVFDEFTDSPIPPRNPLKSGAGNSEKVTKVTKDPSAYRPEILE